MDRLFLLVEFGFSKMERVEEILANYNEKSSICNYSDALYEAKKINPAGIILGGGVDVSKPDYPDVDNEIYELGVPVLSICSGMELVAIYEGGSVGNKKFPKEVGEIMTNFDTSSPLFKNLPANSNTHMFHSFSVEELPDGFEVIAHTETGPFAAMQNIKKHSYGVIFHPEKKYTTYGSKIIENFVEICKNI